MMDSFMRDRLLSLYKKEFGSQGSSTPVTPLLYMEFSRRCFLVKLPISCSMDDNFPIKCLVFCNSMRRMEGGFNRSSFWWMVLRNFASFFFSSTLSLKF